MEAMRAHGKRDKLECEFREKWGMWGMLEMWGAKWGRYKLHQTEAERRKWSWTVPYWQNCRWERCGSDGTGVDDRDGADEDDGGDCDGGDGGVCVFFCQRAWKRWRKRADASARGPANEGMKKKAETRKKWGRNEHWRGNHAPKRVAEREMRRVRLELWKKGKGEESIEVGETRKRIREHAKEGERKMMGVSATERERKKTRGFVVLDC